MATHSSILAWRIPWTEEPGRLQSMGRVFFFFSLRPSQSSDTLTYGSVPMGAAGREGSMLSRCPRAPCVAEGWEPQTYCCSQMALPYLFSGEGNGTPLQYSCLENPMDGAW